MIVALEPGQVEEVEGETLVGPSGVESRGALSRAGLDPNEVSKTNARLCRLPNYEGRRKEHKASLACCRPRLLRDLEKSSSLLLYGAVAVQAIHAGERGSETGLMEFRGYPVTAEIDVPSDDPELPDSILVRPSVATFHPAAVLRKRGLTEIEWSDHAKFKRLITGRSRWVEPELITDPSPETLSNVLSKWEQARSLVAYDIETRRPEGGLDKAEPLTAIMRVLGLGSAEVAVACIFESCETPRRAPRCSPERARERINAFFAAHQGGLAGHNVKNFDDPILARHGVIVPVHRVFDTLIGHHVAHNEWAHSLAFLATQYLDCPRWKPHDHDSWTDDDEYGSYCCRDTVITARVAPLVALEIKEQGLAQVYKSDVRYQEVCSGMHAAGIGIDKQEVSRHRARLVAKQEAAQEEAVSALGGIWPEGASLSQVAVVADVLYRRLRLPVLFNSETTGKPSTQKEAIVALLGLPIPEPAIRFLEALQTFRRCQKWVSTYLDGILWDLEADGRWHPNWRAYATKVGRSGSPAQTLPSVKHDPDSLRSIIAAAPGNVLVGADMDQIHLRIIAGITRDPLWMDAFSKKLDVHKVNAAVYAGLRVDQVGKDLREAWKVWAYLLVYGGTPETFLASLRLLRNAKTGVRPYKSWALEKAQTIYDKFHVDHPSVREWHERAIKSWRVLGYAVDLVLGRRHYFKDGLLGGAEAEVRNEVINWDVLATEAAMMGGSGSAGKFVDRVPFGVFGPGLIYHGHDALLAEVREDRTERTKQALVESMVTDFRGVPMTATPKAGPRMSALE